MKTTGMPIKVVSRSRVQRKIPERHPSKNARRTSGTRSRTRGKKAAALRAGRRPEPGVQIQIGTRYQMERDGEVVGRFTQRTMRMSLVQTVRSRHTPGPGLHPLTDEEECGQRGFLAAPSTRQVCKART